MTQVLGFGDARDDPFGLLDLGARLAKCRIRLFDGRIEISEPSGPGDLAVVGKGLVTLILSYQEHAEAMAEEAARAHRGGVSFE